MGDPLHLEGGKDTKIGFFPDIVKAPVGVGELISSKLSTHPL